MAKFEVVVLGHPGDVLDEARRARRAVPGIRRGHVRVEADRREVGADRPVAGRLGDRPDAVPGDLLDRLADGRPALVRANRRGSDLEGRSQRVLSTPLNSASIASRPSGSAVMSASGGCTESRSVMAGRRSSSLAGSGVAPTVGGSRRPPAACHRAATSSTSHPSRRCGEASGTRSSGWTHVAREASERQRRRRVAAPARRPGPDLAPRRPSSRRGGDVDRLAVDTSSSQSDGTADAPPRAPVIAPPSSRSSRHRGRS